MLASHKSEDLIGQFIVHLTCVDSTNNYAANLVKSGKAESGTVILADEQTNGRGQRGTRWQSEARVNLQLSVIWKPENLLVQDQRYINFAVSIAIRNLLTKKEIEAQIKWPNDILVNQKKISGVLIENQLQGERIHSCIIGIGLNVNQLHFDNLMATSIQLENGKFQTLEPLSEELIFCLNEKLLLVKNRKFKQLQEEYCSALYGFQKVVPYELNNAKFSGKIIGIAEDGNVVIETDGKVKTFGLKEIRFLF
jgi:BirA family transcriptional regulator, biotin operon repressor / biotin---[acetyl-CoA-carboxylase] ligase